MVDKELEKRIEALEEAVKRLDDRLWRLTLALALGDRPQDSKEKEKNAPRD